MGYVLLAIENLAASLLFVAFIVALSSGLSRWAQLGWSVAAVAVWLALYGVAIWADYQQEFVAGSARTGLFVPLLSMTFLFLVGAAIIVRRGLRAEFTAAGEADPRSPAGRPAACFWPRGRLALALGVAVVLNMMTLSNLDAAARQSLNTMRSQAYGLAMSVAPQPVPDDENAATYYLQVFQALEREDLSAEKPRDPRYEVWLAALSAAKDSDANFDFGSDGMTAFIELYQGEVNLLRKGAALPNYYYDRNYGQIDVAMLLPDYQAMQNAMRVLMLHARWSVAKGDVKSALADVTAIAGLARHTAGDPFAIALSLAEIRHRTAFETLQYILRSRNPSADELAEVRVHHLFSYRRQASRVFRAEEAAMLNTMLEVDTALALSTAKWLGGTDPNSTYFGHTSGAISILGLGSFYRVFVLLPGTVAYRRAMQRAYHLTSLPYKQFQSARERLEPQLETQGVYVSAVSGTFSIIEGTYRADAYNLVAYTALAMHRYRAEHGRFPESLAELTPDVIPIVPGDPYNEQPLKLEKTKRGWIVYSVGPDTIDNHGAPLETENMKQLGDVVFVYEEREEG